MQRNVARISVRTVGCLFILIAGAIVLCPGRAVYAEDTSGSTVHAYWSPHHRFSCRIRQGKDSGELVIFRDPSSGKSSTLLTTPRWAQVVWSPDDAWFCVDDQWDPDNNRLHVYHVNHDGTTELVWSTFEAAPDTYWKVLGWRMDDGTIRVEANYVKDYNRPSNGWITRSFSIPVFLPKQKTTEEAYREAVSAQQKQKSQVGNQQQKPEGH